MAHAIAKNSGSIGVKAKEPVKSRPAEPELEQQLGDMAAALRVWDEGQSVDARRGNAMDLGKELARVKGAELVEDMLSKTDYSYRDLQDRFGFQPGALSAMSNGKSKTGPTLWKLFALAEALGLHLELKVSPKDAV